MRRGPFRIAAIVWSLGLAAAPSAWGTFNISGDLTLEAKTLHNRAHEIRKYYNPDYDEPEVWEQDCVDDRLDEWTSHGAATQAGDRIEGYITGEQGGETSDARFLLIGRVFGMNGVEFTVTVPGEVDSYPSGNSYCSYSEERWHCVGVYDPAENRIAGTFEGTQERTYEEWWEYDIEGRQHLHSTERTGIVYTGEFSLQVDGPPKTTHAFSGESRDAIRVTLHPTDDCSGVDVTKYILWTRDGVKSYEGTEFSVDLDNVRKIVYSSIDKAGHREAQHEIDIVAVKESKRITKEYAYNSFNTAPYFYNVDVELNYFRMSCERSEVVFVDRVGANVGPDLCGVDVVAFRLSQGVFSGTIKEKTAGIGLFPEWEDIGVVDWTGRSNNYLLSIQLRSNVPATGKYLSRESMALITPAGGWVLDIYRSDTVVCINIPLRRGLIRSISDALNPFQSNTHPVEVPKTASRAWFSISWPGSDLDLILHEPNGREINPTTAATDPNAEFVEGDTYEQYSIYDPVPGIWTVEVRAVDVPEEGEGYTAVAYSVMDQPLFGDLDSDGEVNLSDLAGLGMHWRRQDCPELDLCSGADLDGNGRVDSSDLSILAAYWLTQTQ